MDCLFLNETTACLSWLYILWRKRALYGSLFRLRMTDKAIKSVSYRIGSQGYRTLGYPDIPAARFDRSVNVLVDQTFGGDLLDRAGCILSC